MAIVCFLYKIGLGVAGIHKHAFLLSHLIKVGYFSISSHLVVGMNQTIFIERIIWKELHPFQTIYLILFIRGKMESLIKRIY